MIGTPVGLCGVKNLTLQTSRCWTGDPKDRVQLAAIWSEDQLFKMVILSGLVSTYIGWWFQGVAGGVLVGQQVCNGLQYRIWHVFSQPFGRVKSCPSHSQMGRKNTSWSLRVPKMGTVPVIIYPPKYHPGTTPGRFSAVLWQSHGVYGYDRN